MSEITSHLDWFTKSYSAAKTPEEIIIQVPGLKVEIELGKVRQYQKGYKMECGGYLLLSRDKKQGSLIELGGEALANMRKLGVSDTLLLEYVNASDAGKHTTRIDYCWNVPTEGATVLSTLAEWNAKRVATRQKKQPKIYGENDPDGHGISEKGCSIYYGSKDSENRVVVYDKAAELGLLSQALTRVELRMRGEYASLMNTDMVKFGALTAAQMKLRSTLDFTELEWWQEMYTGEIVELSPYKPKNKNAVKYLKDTVNPFLMNNIDDIQFAKNAINLMAKWWSEIVELHGDEIHKDLESL